MEEEQEGIELETINPDNEVIEIPTTEIDEEVDELADVDEPEVDEDNEKQKSLQRGVNKERQLRKAAEKKNRELEEKIKALENSNKTPIKSTVDKLIEQGVEESIAKSIADAIDSKNSVDEDTKQELANLKFKVLLTEKSKEEGFEDILDYADEIKELVNKGLTLEQSYYATTYNKEPKTSNTKSEIERKLEAKMQNNIARKEIFGNNLNNNVGASVSNKEKIHATAEEKAIATAAGMTVEEYIAIRDIDSVKDYNSYKSRKK